MPGDLAYMQFDASGEYMLAEARARKKKQKKSINHLKYFADPRGDIKGANLAVWERFLRDYEYALRNFDGVIVDTLTELVDIRKLAEHGRNSQILQIFYGSIYADFRWMVKEARNNDANVVLVHRVKPEYVGGETTGNDVISGWGGIVYETQVYVEHDRNEDGSNFTTTVKECEQNALVTGAVLSSEDEDNDFAGLATRVFPDTDRSEWV